MIKGSPAKALVSKLGWAPQPLDTRDYMFPKLAPTSTPKVDLHLGLAGSFPVYDQGDLGSCTANAIAAAYQYDLIKQHDSDFIPSRLFIYYNERLLENTVRYDSGAYIRDGFKTINTTGVCNETLWPYTISKFTTLPTAPCYTAARLHKSVLYRAVVQSLVQMKAVLNAGYPITLGFLVYESFYNAGYNGGYVTMPQPREQLLGGHAVLVVGYDDSKGMFVVRNSWGSSWGAGGYFYIPYAYYTSPALASDLWVVTSITG